MLNNLAGDEVSAGQALDIPQPRLMLASNETTYEPRIIALYRSGGRADRSGGGKSTLVTYTVRKGDTLSKIARKHRMDLRELARLNHMPMSRSLRVGQSLVISGKGAVASSGGKKAKGKKAASSPGDGKRVTHKVQRGETLHALARKYKVSVHDIARWNDFSAKHELKAGERVKLYLD